MSKSTNNDYLCYICLDQKKTKDLIKPCDTCNIVAHVDCIQAQLDKKNFKCGVCRTKFNTTKKTKINYHDCCRGCGSIMLNIFFEIINWIGLPILYFGKTLVDFDNVAL